MMFKIIKKLYKKWGEWENEELIINFGDYYIGTNNYSIQIIILLIILIYSLL